MQKTQQGAFIGQVFRFSIYAGVYTMPTLLTRKLKWNESFSQGCTIHNGMTIFSELAGAFAGLTASLSFLNAKMKVNINFKTSGEGRYQQLIESNMPGSCQRCHALSLTKKKNKFSHDFYVSYLVSLLHLRKQAWIIIITAFPTIVKKFTNYLISCDQVIYISCYQIPFTIKITSWHFEKE